MNIRILSKEGFCAYIVDLVSTLLRRIALIFLRSQIAYRRGIHIYAGYNNYGEDSRFFICIYRREES